MTKVSPEAVRDILLSPDTHKAMAQRYGISRQTVEQIRFGVGHKNYFPKFLGEILLPNILANVVLCGSRANVLLAFPNQHKIFILLANATSLLKSK
jgi:hypothetical protein